MKGWGSEEGKGSGSEEGKGGGAVRKGRGRGGYISDPNILVCVTCIGMDGGMSVGVP